MGTVLRGTLRFFVIAMGAAALVPAQTTLIVSSTTVPYAGVGQGYSLALNAIGSDKQLFWSVSPNGPGALPSGMSLSSTGQLSGVPSEAGVYPVQVDVMVPDPLAHGSATLNIVVVDVTTAANLGTASAGIVYSKPLSVSAGGTDVTWTLLSGSLPPGIGMSSAGVLSGVPTQAGGYDFTVRATVPNILDRPAVTATKSFSISITGVTAGGGAGTGGNAGSGGNTGTGGNSGTGGNTGTGGSTGTGTGTGTGTTGGTGTQKDTAQPAGGDGSTALTITTLALPNAAFGQPFSTQLTAFGGLGTYVWSATYTPPGLTLSPSGVLSGTPTSYGILPVIFSVSAGAQTVSNDGILMAIVAILPQTLPDGEVASAYSQEFNVTFGIPVWSPVSGTLPDGLTFTNGILSGAFTKAGSFTFTITATITTLQGTVVIPQQYTMKVNATTPVVISGAVLPYAGLNQSYRTQLTADGGNGEFAWSLLGAPPPGLFLTVDGLLVGQPTQTGTFPFSVQVNSAKVKGTAQLTVIVIGILTGSTLAPAQATAPYTNQLAVSTGFAQWSIVSGTLPTGFSLSPEGFLQGTTSAQGSYAFRAHATVTNIVTDAPTVYAEKDFVLVVGPPPLSIGNAALSDAHVQNLYNQELQITGGKAPYRLSVTGAANWLGVNGASIAGTPPDIGTFAVTVTVTDSASATATRTYSLNVTPLGPLSAKVSVTPRILRFSIPEGGEVSPPQNVTVVSTTSVAVAFTADAPGAPWLQVDSPTGNTPRAMAVRALSAGLQVGTYSGALRFTVDGQLAIDMPVLLEVTAVHPNIEARPGVLRFTSSRGTPRVFERLVVLDNRGGGPAITFEPVLVNNSRWITAVTATPALIGNGSASYVRVRVDTQSLAPGAYRETLRIVSRTGTRDVPVSLFVSDSGPSLDVNARGVLLTARDGQGSDPKQTVKIGNSGDAGSGVGSTVNWTAEIVRGSSAFTLTPSSGTASPGNPSTMEIGLKPGTADVAGVNSAIIRITDAGAQQSPRYLVAVANIADSKLTPASPVLTPGGLMFFAHQNAASPLPKTVTVSASNAEPVRFTATATSDGSGDWLAVQPTSGVTATGMPATLQVSATTGRLAPGIHTGMVHVGIGGEVRDVLVSFVVGGAIGDTDQSATPDSREILRGQMADAGACVPKRVGIIQTALAGNFAAPAGWPVSLSVNMADDCGTAVANGSVVVHFSNGDAPIVLDGGGITGEYTGTWQPGTVDAQTTVTLEGAAGTLAAAKIEITGGVVSNPALPPSIDQDGLVNNLSGEIGGALAPGTMSQIHGSNFSIYTSRPGATPLPTLMLGVEAIIGGLSAPIYYLSPTQLGIQIPYELAPNKTYSAIVAVRDAYSLPQMVDVVPVQPGVQTADGMLLAYHADGTAVTADSPALPGEEISAFLVGMGATSPTVPSGSAAPNLPPVMVVNQARVLVNGQSATPTFQGLVPGQVGLYRVSFRLPLSATPGLADVVISQNGVAANTGKLPVAAQ